MVQASVGPADHSALYPDETRTFTEWRAYLPVTSLRANLHARLSVAITALPSSPLGGRYDVLVAIERRNLDPSCI